MDIQHRDLDSNWFGQGNLSFQEVTHHPEIITMGHTEPVFEFFSSCSCGWRGITFEEEPHEKVVESLIPPVREIVREHGTKALLRPGTEFGDYHDAVWQVLEHIDYSGEDDVRRMEERFISSRTSLTEIANESSYSGEHLEKVQELSHKLAEDAEYLHDSLVRKHIYSQKPLAGKKDPDKKSDPELYALVKSAMDEYFNRGEQPPF